MASPPLHKLRQPASPDAETPPSGTPIPLHPDAEFPPLASLVDRLGEALHSDGALGLILVDATPLAGIERIYGAPTFRRALRALAQRVRNRLAREAGPSFTVATGALCEEHLLFFLHRARADARFWTHGLEHLADELRGYVSLSLRRIAYPYLTRSPALALGSSLVLDRPFERPTTQIRTLIESALQTARFEREKSRRAAVSAIARIVVEESVTSVYEPIVRLADLSPIGYEALARGPVGSGLESPIELFNAAAEANLTFELDALCRRSAVRGAGSLDALHRLFLNILPSSVHDPDFTEHRIRLALEKLGMAPRNLVLEISEREAIANYPIFREAVDRITRMGVGIALDDTGTGYASLEAAMELDPDFLKIDISLVRRIEDDPQRQELLRGLQRMAAQMDARVIAEGIETDRELDSLRELGIELGQGFLFARGGPIPPA
ncbi:MAG: EAL domain-containing protein [Myxococcota bacterium]